MQETGQRQLQRLVLRDSLERQLEPTLQLGIRAQKLFKRSSEVNDSYRAQYDEY